MALIIVGMADLKIAKSPDVLTTLGLGSCVGVTLFDKVQKIGGLVHVMLPYSGDYAGGNRAKFADTGIADLVEMMVRAGALRPQLAAKIAGGAHMFGGSTNNILKVGERNIAACIDVLAYLRIPIAASDTGGKYGRTIELCPDTGALKVKAVGRGERLI